MKFTNYIKDNLYAIVLFFVFSLLFFLLLFAFRLPSALIIVMLLLFFLFFLLLFWIPFFRKKTFYDKLDATIQKLDKRYLILEMVSEPNFYEGKLFYQILYETNKSMIEHLKQYEFQMNDFKEYIEMWIHEVKIPIASLILMNHNHQGLFSKKSLEQIRRIETDVEQVLYYVRSENTEKDYLINEVVLQKVITEVALKHKDDLLENQIDFCVQIQNQTVLTDLKWLEFIVSQIINNSIQYKDDKKASYIKIVTIEEEDKVVLQIEDNGIGIPINDVKRVFEKSFTGQNGRKKAQSTGMGLFIAKSLCHKLGHKIQIESKEHEYTQVSIIFLKNHYYDVLK